MRCGAGLFALTRPDTEHMCLFNTVLLIGERGIERAHGKCMCTCGFVQERSNCGIECPQCLVIEVIQKIPEQAKVKACIFGKIEGTNDMFSKLCFRAVTQLHL